MAVLYGFEVVSIQTYILSSGKLRDMIGASTLVEQLSGDILDGVLAALNLSETKPRFLRRAGGGFRCLLPDEATAQRLRDAWSLAVQTQAPGLGFVHAVVTGEDVQAADEKLDRKLREQRGHSLPWMPLAGPYSVRAPRTGYPAVDRERHGELLDPMTRNKREWSEKPGIEKLLDLGWEGVTWPKQFHPDEEGDEPALVKGEPGERTVGIIHADGNGLGRIVEQVKTYAGQGGRDYVAVMAAFSDAVATATRQAVTQAASLFVPFADGKGGKIEMPARPLVMAGDDITIVVRGEHALMFAKAMLLEFEKASEQAFKKIEKQCSGLEDLPTLTACAGIAFVKANQPFMPAYRLCESLCQHAKTESKKHKDPDKRVPPSLAFHRVTTSMIDDFETVLARELAVVEKRTMSMQPYGVDGTAPQLPQLDDLEDLGKLVLQSSRGSVHALTQLLHEDHDRVQRAMTRWMENMAKLEKSPSKEDQPSFGKGLLQRWRVSLKRLVPEPHNDFSSEATLPLLSKQGRCPLGDALVLVEVQGGSHA